MATGSDPVVTLLFPEGKPEESISYGHWNRRERLRALQTARTAVVIGAGLIGLKTALALRQRGLEVAIVEKMPGIMPLQLDETASSILAAKITGLGVRVFTSAEVKAVQAVDGKVTGVVSDHGFLAADMVIVAVGVRPNVTLARGAGLTVQRGIVTNEFLETSVAGIYAAGDVAEVNDLLTGEPVVPAIWPAAVEQGRFAAFNMAGERVAYDGATAMNSVEIAGVPLISVGAISAGSGAQVLSRQSGDTYRKIVLHGKTARGALFLGDIRPAGVIANLVLRHAEVNELDLFSPTFSFASVMSS